MSGIFLPATYYKLKSGQRYKNSSKALLIYSPYMI